MRKFLAGAVAVVFVLGGCAAYERAPRTVKGAGIGAAAGAATGAAVGAIVGGGKGAGQGAAIGAVLGAIGGGLIGNYLDQQAKEMQAILAEQDRLRREQERLDVALSTDILFASGSATLQPGARDKIRQLAAVLNRYPRTYIQVIGHTDSRGSEESNLELSRRRAQAVAEELVSAGVSASRITTFGRGASSPVATNDTPEGRAMNRRVEIVIQPDEGLRREHEQGGAYEDPR
ncbi:MAG: OmpA family protein [Candidatus Binatia bacterium]|nr:OmpA family protein [Candidatus Binatia bacterium]